MKKLEYPQHRPFFSGDLIRKIHNNQRVIAKVLTAASMRSSVTGAWYLLSFQDGSQEYNCGMEWMKFTP